MVAASFPHELTQSGLFTNATKPGCRVRGTLCALWFNCFNLLSSISFHFSSFECGIFYHTAILKILVEEGRISPFGTAGGVWDCKPGWNR